MNAPSTPACTRVLTLPKFWTTQPVPQLGKSNRFSEMACLNNDLGDQPPAEDGYIEPTKKIEEVRQEPYPLPKDFEWSTLDLNDPKQVCPESIHFPYANIHSRSKRSMTYCRSTMLRMTRRLFVSSTALNSSNGKSRIPSLEIKHLHHVGHLNRRVTPKNGMSVSEFLQTRNLLPLSLVFRSPSACAKSELSRTPYPSWL